MFLSRWFRIGLVVSTYCYGGDKVEEFGVREVQKHETFGFGVTATSLARRSTLPQRLNSPQI